MAKYLVTGGCGFIGSHLVDALVLRGDDVVVVDNLFAGKLENLNPKAKFVNGEITDFLLINKLLKGMDGCFHLAAVVPVEYGNTHWLQAHAVNLTGTITILDCAKYAKNGNPIPVVYASSAAIYGDNPEVPLVESAKPSPLSVYAADKLSSEFHAHVAYKIYRIPTVGLRLFDVYGPRQDPKSHYAHVISTFFEQMVSNKAIKIFGDGNQERDFIYVSDVVNYFLKAMDSMGQKDEIYNVCSGMPVTINQLVAIMKEILHKETVEITHEEAKATSIVRSIGDPAIAQKRFNLQAGVELKQGLTEMLKSFYKTHHASLQSQCFKNEVSN